MNNNQTENPKCCDCSHFLPAPVDPKNLQAPPTGICFRYPPQIVVIHGSHGTQIQMMNPMVQTGHHCGEFTEGTRVDLGTIPFKR